MKKIIYTISTCLLLTASPSFAYRGGFRRGYRGRGTGRVIRVISRKIRRDINKKRHTKYQRPKIQRKPHIKRIVSPK